MHYIEDFEFELIEDSKQALVSIQKEYLKNLIYSEQPHLAKKIVIDNPDEETQNLLGICKSLAAILSGKIPPKLPDWSGEFEGRHHSITMIALRAMVKWEKQSLHI
ncbi:MAG: hypothetical protein IJ557_08015 [Bacteroidaceae bacterium]|nr:hypothetical protein [Bacteroidaceae bacterium]